MTRRDRLILSAMAPLLISAAAAEPSALYDWRGFYSAPKPISSLHRG